MHFLVPTYFERMNKFADGLSDDFQRLFKEKSKIDFNDLDDDTQLLVLIAFDLGHLAGGAMNLNTTVDLNTGEIKHRIDHLGLKDQ